MATQNKKPAAKKPADKPVQPKKDKPLDGSVGGALDVFGKSGEVDPESTENIDDGRGLTTKAQRGPELNKKIADAVETINELKAQRSLINAQITAVIEDVEAQGINRHAFRFAMKFLEMATEQREGLDFSLAVARSAMGQPMQAEMFPVDVSTK